MQNEQRRPRNLDSVPSRRGDIIGTRYVLGDVLGIGGMGVVYAATQHSLDRTVAIKLPRTELVSDPQVRLRFRNEALASSRINHPNVVRVFDFGDDQGAPYLVMEHIIGPGLGQLVTDHGPMPSAMAARISRQIVAGLEDAHAHGIIHADVKSDNILVETVRDGSLVPRLIDFGIARILNDRVIDSNAAMVSGTPEYLAPEVIRGGPPTFASDIYAAGVILYELITGATPFAGGSSAEVMSGKLDGEAVPMTWRRPDLDIPSDLDALVVCALARDPVGRFANASAMGHALDTITRTGATMRPRPRRSTAPSVFTSEATTAVSMDSIPSATRHTPASEEQGRSAVAKRRVAVLAAMTACDVDAMAIAYLELARALVDEHQLAAAVIELDEGVELLSLPDGTGPVWRLLLTLAALHDGNGDRPRARIVAGAARDQAARAGSAIGCERAERLCERLTRGRSTTRSTGPW